MREGPGPSDASDDSMPDYGQMLKKRLDIDMISEKYVCLFVFSDTTKLVLRHNITVWNISQGRSSSDEGQVCGERKATPAAAQPEMPTVWFRVNVGEVHLWDGPHPEPTVPPVWVQKPVEEPGRCRRPRRSAADRRRRWNSRKQTGTTWILTCWNLQLLPFYWWKTVQHSICIVHNLHCLIFGVIMY